VYAVGKVWVLFVVNVKVSPLLSCTTIVPVRPVAATLIVKVVTAEQVTVRKREPNTVSSRLRDFTPASRRIPEFFSRYLRVCLERIATTALYDKGKY
jgi:hypothetical protein